jgi:hypothetical protein
MIRKSDKSDTISNVQARTKLMKEKFLETLALDRVSGNVLIASYAVGLSRQTVYRWRSEDGKFAQRWEEIVSKAIDVRVELAEDKLFELVLKGNITAIINTLKWYKPEVYNRRVISGDKVSPKRTYTPSPRFMRLYNRMIKETS